MYFYLVHNLVIHANHLLEYQIKGVLKRHLVEHQESRL